MFHTIIKPTLLLFTIASIALNAAACQKKTEDITTNPPPQADTQAEEAVPMSAEPAEPNNSLVANDIDTQPITDIDHNTNTEPEIVDVIDVEPMVDEVDTSDNNTDSTENSNQ